MGLPMWKFQSNLNDHSIHLGLCIKTKTKTKYSKVYSTVSNGPFHILIAFTKGIYYIGESIYFTFFLTRNSCALYFNIMIKSHDVFLWCLIEVSLMVNNSRKYSQRKVVCMSSIWNLTLA